MKRKSRIGLVITVLGLWLLVIVGYQRRDRASHAVDDSDHLPRPEIVGANSHVNLESTVSLGSHAHEELLRAADGGGVAAGVAEVREELSEPDIIAALQTLTTIESMAQIENLVQQLAAKNYEAALAFAREQPAGFVRERLVERVAFAQAQESPERAARLVMEEIAPGQRQSEAAMMVLHQWALRDPSGAAAWIELFPEGTLKKRAERELHGIKSAAR